VRENLEFERRKNSEARSQNPESRIWNSVARIKNLEGLRQPADRSQNFEAIRLRRMASFLLHSFILRQLFRDCPPKPFSQESEIISPILVPFILASDF